MVQPQLTLRCGSAGGAGHLLMERLVVRSLEESVGETLNPRCSETLQCDEACCMKHGEFRDQRVSDDPVTCTSVGDSRGFQSVFAALRETVSGERVTSKTSCCGLFLFLTLIKDQKLSSSTNSFPCSVRGTDAIFSRPDETARSSAPRQPAFIDPRRLR